MLPASLCCLSNTSRSIGHPEGIANKNNQSSIFDGTLLNLFLSRQRTRLFFRWCALSSSSRSQPSGSANLIPNCCSAAIEGDVMRHHLHRSFALTFTIIFFLSGAALSQAGTCAGMTVGQLTSLNGFVPFPSNSLWNTDISASPVDPNSANYINFIGTTVTLHPDFGAETFHNQSIGIPYQVVAGSQAKVPVKLGAFFDESDPGPDPIPSNALIEGYPKPGNGDRHVLVLEKDGCWLYELYHANLKSGQWSADSAAIWDMTINEQRPYTWTSADAAGLPIFVGLARHDEVAAGAINHALRFTVPTTRRAFVLPATHWASTLTDPNAPPMGTRLRLKASFDISGYRSEEQVILTALKKYGMILADNGSAIFISGTPDDRWNNTNLNLL